MARSELSGLADELRAELIDVVSTTGGHFGAGLGVIELTIALHYVFDTPRDRLVWDVSHQAYPHKILTGRRDRMRTIRKGGGLSGFTRRAESEYDPFGAAHSSTSVSAALGMAAARDRLSNDHHVVCVMGDGAMSAGMAYEALNNAGTMNGRLIVILNDNGMSIAPAVGALSKYLIRLVGPKERSALLKSSGIANHLRHQLGRAAERATVRADEMPDHGNLFEELGFLYLGPIDGHNLEHLVPLLEEARDVSHDGPILIHIVTAKGHGYAPAAASKDRGHAVGKFDVRTGHQAKPKASAPSYTRVFADALIAEAAKDPKIVAITAAMPSGTGLDVFAKSFPDRMFDVGIAEQHAVTFAAGMAADGLKPFCAIYSTFLQRAYDQVVHDVAIQKLPVRFAMDRAGLVGADGPTHAGSFDLAYLGCLPGMVIMAPSDEAELVHMVATAAAYDQGPIACRYPRGNGTGVPLPVRGDLLEIGKGRVIREGTDVALLSLGTRLAECLAAAERLQECGISCTVADARFAKPLDRALVRHLTRNHRLLVTAEEGTIGGFGTHVLSFLANERLLRAGLEICTLTLPDSFIDQDDPRRQYDTAGLNADNIVETVQARLPRRTFARGLRRVMDIGIRT